MAKSVPNRQPYDLYGNTEFGKYGYDIGRKGYKGITDNYDKVNVFSPETQASLDATANDVGRRAETDFNRTYNESMRKLADKNYNQFGTLNATQPAYRTDMYNLQKQRELADMAYDKSLYRNDLENQELQRRYNTLDMFNNMFKQGNEVGQSDWNTTNTNKDIQYMNDIANFNAGNRASSYWTSMVDPFKIWGLEDSLYPTYDMTQTTQAQGLSGQKALQAILSVMGLSSGNIAGGLSGLSSLGSSNNNQTNNNYSYLDQLKNMLYNNSVNNKYGNTGNFDSGYTVV